jgi:hypothetical protein
MSRLLAKKCLLMVMGVLLPVAQVAGRLKKVPLRRRTLKVNRLPVRQVPPLK